MPLEEDFGLSDVFFFSGLWCNLKFFCLVSLAPFSFKIQHELFQPIAQVASDRYLRPFGRSLTLRRWRRGQKISTNRSGECPRRPTFLRWKDSSADLQIFKRCFNLFRTHDLMEEQKELGELPTFQKLEEVVTSFKAFRFFFLGGKHTVVFGALNVGLALSKA